MPLWTGIIIEKHKQKDDASAQFISSRLTNNYVENYFGNLKKNVFVNHPTVSPSEFATDMYALLLSKYFKFYQSQIDTECLSSNESSRNEKVLVDEKEGWCKNAKSVEQKKGFYYECADLGVDIENEKNERLDFESFFVDLERKRGSFSFIDSLYDQLSGISDFNAVSRLLAENKGIIESAIGFMKENLEKQLYKYAENPGDNSFLKIIEMNQLIGYRAANVESDGNCFYRAISYLVFGSEDEFIMVKLCSLFIAQAHRFIFENLIKLTCHPDDYEFFILKSFKTNEWANEFNIFSAAIMLGTPIVCLNFVSEERSPGNQNFSFSHQYLTSSVPKLAIVLKNKHFVPLVPPDTEQLEKLIDLKTVDFFGKYLKMME